ncbi:hypothetical protein SHKM778_70120 [Streptomyces sp. KM77-8]|uniref:Uncharacterized protein n=1 Tax=Streptomyces haneummycinicus TaxID=3074435 RepID=A0AAT9HSK5_9ACTN
MHQQRHPGHPRRLLEAEHLLQLHGEHRPLRVGVVDPDSGPTGHRDPLGGEFVEPRGLPGGPRQQPRERLPRVDPRQVGPPPGPAQLRLQPLVHARAQCLVGDIGPRRTEPAVQKRQPLPQYGGPGRPPQQPEPLLPQPVQQRRPYE